MAIYKQGDHPQNKKCNSISTEFGFRKFDDVKSNLCFTLSSFNLIY